MVVAAQRIHPLRQLRPARPRRGQRKRRRPALSAVNECLDRRQHRIDPFLLQRFGGLGRRHREILHVQLEDLGAGTHPAQRQRRLTARRHRQLATFGQPAQHVEHRVSQRRRSDDMRVVQDEREALTATGRDIARAQRVGNRVGQDAGIRVGVVQRHPGAWAVVLLRPLRQERRLAVSGGGPQQDQRAVALLREAAEQIGAPHGSSPHPGRCELRVGHVDAKAQPRGHGRGQIGTQSGRGGHRVKRRPGRCWAQGGAPASQRDVATTLEGRATSWRLRGHRASSG